MNTCMRMMLISLCLVFVAGCSTVTVSPQGKPKLARDPDFEDSKSFFLFGVVGKQEVDITKPCGGQEPVQFQTQSTFMDSFLTVITIGIYAPRTVKVWCGKGV